MSNKINNKIRKEFFKCILFNKDINVLLKKYNVTKETADLWARKWIIKNYCKYCEQRINEEDFDVSSSYWNNFWEATHKECKEKGDKKEEVECQKIDKNCNECKYFKRKGFDEKLLDTQGNKLFNSIGCYFGKCEKVNKNVTATRNICQGNKCFIHRLN